ncbi:OmpA family protein [Pseudomonas sp. SWI44]|uniref:OmpA/MotB family protein n=1 Tax=Pseudomonas sp. SWI44 TaxID=2083053 RepID=UPI000CE5D55A|nr:OmpA family protein [Pseudomonas sp. SWI44]AVD88303.1 protein MotD [Pseudomonas sp. SWI44]
MSLLNASHNSVADNRHWLAHQRALEVELMKARERQCNLKRSAIAPAWLGDTAAQTDAEGWMMTYLDLMTLLLVMVLAMLAQAMISRNQPTKMPSGLSQSLDVAQLIRVEPPGALLRVAQIAPEQQAVAEAEPIAEEPIPSAPETESNPLVGLPLEQLGSDIQVIRNERSISFRIDSSILFHSGQTDLDPRGLQALQRLARVLSGIPHRIIVAGHTDNRTIRNARYPSNWELSGARAGSVVRYLQQQGIAGVRLTAVGLADTQPLADNSDAQGRAKNRRVELTLERPEP